MAENVAVEVDDNDVRVDRWFKRHYPTLAHGVLEKLLRTGQVRVDRKRAKASDRLSTGQVLRLPPQLQAQSAGNSALPTKASTTHKPSTDREKKDAEALVIHKDASVLVLNKPPGLATQGGSGITRHVDGLLEHLKFGKKQKPRLVHRLDRDTSGVLVVARTVPAAAALSESLRRRDAQKIYWALVRGVPKKRVGTIKIALAKEGGRGNEKMVGVERDAEDSKPAITDYVVIDHAGAEYAWVAAKPVTGRTHQIRVHLASLGTPIVGDFKYGGAAAQPAGDIDNRLHLHARSIDIAHPDGGRLRAIAPLPPHMQKAWKLLGFAESEARDPFPKRPK
ncbi:MAG TPA: RluA family pseudouridine synthase [Rhizomicrobium sp.]|nr:RluA family pseudouridine synthase [Rhizomicrobium sp.]